MEPPLMFSKGICDNEWCSCRHQCKGACWWQAMALKDRRRKYDGRNGGERETVVTYM